MKIGGVDSALAHGKEYSLASRGSLETFRQLVADIEALVDDILLKPSAVV